MRKIETPNGGTKTYRKSKCQRVDPNVSHSDSTPSPTKAPSLASMSYSAYNDLKTLHIYNIPIDKTTPACVFTSTKLQSSFMSPNYQSDQHVKDNFSYCCQCERRINIQIIFL